MLTPETKKAHKEDRLNILISISYGGGRGAGHLSRTFYYLHQLALRTSIIATFIIDSDSSSLANERRQKEGSNDLKVNYISAPEAREAAKTKGGKIYDILMIDRCSLDPKLFRLKDYCKKVVVIADGLDNEYLPLADLIIDFNYGAERLMTGYQELSTKNCKLLLGWEYAPIKADAERLDERFLHRVESQSPQVEVLISMGSEDPLGFTEKALRALSNSRLLQDVRKVKVVEGPLFKRYISNSYSFDFETVKAPPTLHDDYINADLCISTGGVSTWERISALLPTRLVPYSERQRSILLPLHEMGIIQIFQDFTTLCEDPINMQKHLEQIKAMCKIPLGSRAHEAITSILER